MEMVNVTSETIKCEIAGTPGSKPKQYVFEPGQPTEVPDGYCVLVQGAGRNVLEPIIVRMTKRSAYKNGKAQGQAKPTLVRASEYDATKDYGWPKPKVKATPAPPADVDDDDTIPVVTAKKSKAKKKSKPKVKAT